MIVNVNIVLGKVNHKIEIYIEGNVWIGENYVRPNV